MFRPRTAPEAIDLVSKLLEYTPEVRLSAVEAMVHPFFDELRAEGAKMPNGKEFPSLFDFTREGSWAERCCCVTGGADLRGDCRALSETRPDSQACTTTLRRGVEVTVNRHQQLQTHTAGAVEDYA